MDTKAELTEEINRLKEELERTQQERDDLRTGIVLQTVLWQRKLLAKFARQCELWGVTPCHCCDRANDVLRKTRMIELIDELDKDE